jgi:hypothetical protein
LGQSVSARDTSAQAPAAFKSEVLDSPPLDAWHATCKLKSVTAFQTISLEDRAVRAEAPAAAIYSFVPAGGAEGARNESRRAVRQLTEALRAYLAETGDDRAVLLADFSGPESHPRSSIVCQDLSDADPAEACEAIRVSEAVFLVSTTDAASIEDACAHASWLRCVMRSLTRDDECGLLLVPTRGGIAEFEAEHRTGLPVCGVFRSADHTAQLARWIAQD